MRFLVLTASLLAVLPALAAPETDAWSVAVQQGERTFDSGSPVRLQRAPFKLVFTGPASLGFGVAAATSCEGLEGLKTPEQILRVIGPMNIAAEYPVAQQNRDLVVNRPVAQAPDAVTAHTWSESPEFDTHSFQELKPLPGGQRASTRQVETLVSFAANGKRTATPVARYSGAGLCLLVTGLPPVGYMAHTLPRLVRIAFE